MTFQNLRQNAVAYLALAVALSTGTAYAADKIADGSVTTTKLARGAVTKAKIKKDAVTSNRIRNGSVSASDLAPGAVQDATWTGGVTFFMSGDPSATPDLDNRGVLSFTVPRSGDLQLTMHFVEITATCSAGSAFAGLYLDQKPVPGTRFEILASPISKPVIGTAPVGAGAHVVHFAIDCPGGNLNSYSPGGVAWSLLLSGGSS